MTNGELIEKLLEMDLDSNVTAVFHNGEGVEVADVEMVVDNGGPSLYVRGWDFREGPANVGKSRAVREIAERKGMKVVPVSCDDDEHGDV
jgi:hypothetical protein